MGFEVAGLSLGTQGNAPSLDDLKRITHVSFKMPGRQRTRNNNGRVPVETRIRGGGASPPGRASREALIHVWRVHPKKKPDFPKAISGWLRVVRVVRVFVIERLLDSRPIIRPGGMWMWRSADRMCSSPGRLVLATLAKHCTDEKNACAKKGQRVERVRLLFLFYLCRLAKVQSGEK
jgi:hypothetical protein